MSGRRHRKRAQRQGREAARWAAVIDRFEAEMRAWATQDSRIEGMAADLAAALPELRAALADAARRALDPARSEAARAAARARFDELQRTARADYHEFQHARAQLGEPPRLSGLR